MTFKEKWKKKREERKAKKARRKIGFFFKLFLGGIIKRVVLPVVKEKLKERKIATEVINIVEDSIKKVL